MKTTRSAFEALNLVAIAVVCLGLQFAVASNGSADTQTEQALVTSGFKVQRADTPAKRAQLRSMPDNQFTTVKQNGNTYYLFADKKDARLYAGDQYAYRAYQGFIKNKNLRERGIFVWEVNPSDRSSNRTIQVWHDWTPFDQWR